MYEQQFADNLYVLIINRLEAPALVLSLNELG